MENTKVITNFIVKGLQINVRHVTTKVVGAIFTHYDR